MVCLERQRVGFLWVSKGLKNPNTRGPSLGNLISPTIEECEIPIHFWGSRFCGFLFGVWVSASFHNNKGLMKKTEKEAALSTFFVFKNIFHWPRSFVLNVTYAYAYAP